MSRFLLMLARWNLALALLLWAGSASAAKIACVGDSITYGYGLSNPGSESYPAVLQELLGTSHTVGNFGVSGATLLKSGDRPYWNESRYADSDAFAPDIVIIMLGTNDAKPNNWANSAAFSGDYRDLIDHYRALGAVVYVAMPPPVFDPGAFDISPSVLANEVVPLVEQIASDAEAPVVDVFQAASGSGNLFPDTVHPNAAGARLLAETVQAALIEHGFDSPVTTGSGGTGSGGMGSGGMGSGGMGSGGTGNSSTGNVTASTDGSGAGGSMAGGTATTEGGLSTTISTSAASGTTNGTSATVGTSASTASSSNTGGSINPTASTTGATLSSDSGGSASPSKSRDEGGCQLRTTDSPGSGALISLVLMLSLGLARRRGAGSAAD